MLNMFEEDAKSKNSSAKKRERGAVASYAYTIVQIVVNLLYVPLLLTCIGQEEYGLYQIVASVMAYIGTINTVLSSGVGRYYSMYFAEQDFKMMENTLAIAKRIYWIVSFLVLILVVLLVPIVRLVYSNSFTAVQLDEFSIMLIILAINLVINFNNAINIAVINSNERFVFLKLTQLFVVVIQPVAILVVTQFFPNVIVVSLVTLTANLIGAILQRIYAKNILKAKFTYHGLDKALLKGLFRYSSTVVLVVVADQLFWNTGKLVIAYYFGTGVVAVYAIGAQINSVYMTLGGVVSSVFFQRISDLYHYSHDFQTISNLFIKVGRITFFVCSIVLGGFIVIGQDFVRVWAGDGFDDAYFVALALMLPITVDLVQNLGLTVMQVSGNYGFRGRIYILLSLVSVVVCTIAAPMVGNIGVACISGACALLGNGPIMNWYYWKKLHLDIRRFWKELGKLFILICIPLIVSVVLYSFLELYFDGLLLMIMGGAIYLIVWFLVMFNWGVNSEEKAMIGMLVRNRK